VAVALEESGSLNVLRLEGGIDIASAAELKELLVKALEPGKELRVALGGVTDLDVTAVQLLWAARQKACAAGVGFTFTDSLPEALLGTLNQAGFQSSLFFENNS
jgi:anti-anti-sigma factor